MRIIWLFVFALLQSASAEEAVSLATLDAAIKALQGEVAELKSQNTCLRAELDGTTCKVQPVTNGHVLKLTAVDA